MSTTEKSKGITDKHFIDWEGEVFGYGYGTGELPILKCLHFFFSTLEDGKTYNHEKLEKELGDAATWFMINTLCHTDIIEYGTSPRFGWISYDPPIQALRDYILGHTPEELYEIVANRDDDYVHCYKGHCNCETPCNNPLFS